MRFFLDPTAPAGMTIGETTGVVNWPDAAPNAGPDGHTITVVALDVEDARATQSYLLIVEPNQPPQITFEITVTADTTEPNVSLTTSAPLFEYRGTVQYVADLDGTVRFQVHATDDVGVESVTLTVAGSAVALAGNGSAVVTMDADGSVLVVATAVDAAGNPASESN